MFKSVSIVVFLMVLVAHGSARPAISTKSLGNKLTPSITLVFQSLHSVAKASKHQTNHESQEKSPELMAQSQQLDSVPKDDRSVVPVAIEIFNKDWLLTNPGGVFGDAESSRLSSIVVPPVSAF